LNKVPNSWKTQDGRNYKISEMGWSHLLNTVRMLATQQLAEYNPKRQEYIEVLQNELDRRKFKKKTKDLF
jgi:hypothetical protein